MTSTRNQPALVARALIVMHARPTIAFWVILLVIFDLITIGVAIFGHLHRSIWETSFDGVALYFPLALGLALTPVHLPVFVANGVTRRNFGTGALVFVAAFTVVSAIALTLGYAVEDLIFAIAGKRAVLNSPQLFGSTGQLPAIFGESLLQVGAYLATGWLIGTTFRRIGPWALALLIPELLPAVCIGVMLKVGWLGQVGNAMGIVRPPMLVAVLIETVLIVAAAVCAALMLRVVTANLPQPYQQRSRVYVGL